MLTLYLLVFQCETLQMEMDSLKEKLEEVTIDMQIMKEEISTAGKGTPIS